MRCQSSVRPSPSTPHLLRSLQRPPISLKMTTYLSKRLEIFIVLSRLIPKDDIMHRTPSVKAELESYRLLFFPAKYCNTVVTGFRWQYISVLLADCLLANVLA